MDGTHWCYHYTIHAVKRESPPGFEPGTFELEARRAIQTTLQGHCVFLKGPHDLLVPTGNWTQTSGLQSNIEDRCAIHYTIGTFKGKYIWKLHVSRISTGMALCPVDPHIASVFGPCTGTDSRLNSSMYLNEFLESRRRLVTSSFLLQILTGTVFSYTKITLIQNSSDPLIQWHYGLFGYPRPKCPKQYATKDWTGIGSTYLFDWSSITIKVSRFWTYK